MIADLPRAKLQCEVTLDYLPAGAEWSIKGSGLLVDDELDIAAE